MCPSSFTGSLILCMVLFPLLTARPSVAQDENAKDTAAKLEMLNATYREQLRNREPLDRRAESAREAGLRPRG